jgi:hypothetical protein
MADSGAATRAFSLETRNKEDMSFQCSTGQRVNG